MAGVDTPARGRPRLGPDLRSVSVSLSDGEVESLRRIGRGNVSAGIRALVGERDTLAAALTRACADLLSVDRAEGDTATAAELAAEYVEIAKTEAWERANKGG